MSLSVLSSMLSIRRATPSTLAMAPVLNSAPRAFKASTVGRTQAPTMLSPQRRWWSRKGERRADRAGVQPQRQLGQLDRHAVLVDAVDDALEDNAPDNVAVVELRFGDRPSSEDNT